MALIVENLSHNYSMDTTALQEVSLDIQDGEIVAVVGRSGCGKTTLLHCIAGLIAPMKGNIYIDGIDVSDVKPHERGVGIMMQDQPFYEHLTVEQNIAFPLRVRGESTDVDEIIESLRLDRVAKQRISLCSGGERRRVALGRAIVLQPRVLLLDEPLISLDRELRDSMQQLIQRVHTASNASTLLVTHNFEEVEAQCDRIVTMENL